MDFLKVLLLFAAAVEAAAAAAAAAEAAAAAAAAAAVNLTRKVGEDVTLSLEHGRLKHGDTLVWSYGPVTGKENVLFDIDIGNYDGPTQRNQFDLDLTSGALTIKHLSATNSTVYHGQIINGNSTKRTFNLTVEGPEPIQPIQPIQPTDEPQQHANTGIIISVVVVVLLLLLICFFIAFIVKKKKLCSIPPTVV